MGQQTYFAIFAPPGRLAQLVQSTSFTPRGSGVRVPHRPLPSKSPCHAGAFLCPGLEMVSCRPLCEDGRGVFQHVADHKQTSTHPHHVFRRSLHQRAFQCLHRTVDDHALQPRSKLGDCTCRHGARNVSRTPHVRRFLWQQGHDFAVVFVRHCAPNHRQSASAPFSQSRSAFTVAATPSTLCAPSSTTVAAWGMSTRCHRPR